MSDASFDNGNSFIAPNAFVAGAATGAFTILAVKRPFIAFATLFAGLSGISGLVGLESLHQATGNMQQLHERAQKFALVSPKATSTEILGEQTAAESADKQSHSSLVGNINNQLKSLGLYISPGKSGGYKVDVMNTVGLDSSNNDYKAGITLSNAEHGLQDLGAAGSIGLMGLAGAAGSLVLDQRSRRKKNALPSAS